jgi:hypothetical protein
MNSCQPKSNTFLHINGLAVLIDAIQAIPTSWAGILRSTNVFNPMASRIHIHRLGDYDLRLRFHALGDLIAYDSTYHSTEDFTITGPNFGGYHGPD